MVGILSSSSETEIPGFSILKNMIRRRISPSATTSTANPMMVLMTVNDSQKLKFLLMGLPFSALYAVYPFSLNESINPNFMQR
jgi:hypothetical protein